jgi:hypothetical protein
MRGAGAETDELALGRSVFDATCSACHTVEPPPRTAPPMSHITRHYLAASADTAAAVQRVAQWLSAPSAAASVLPAHAIEEWGLMPPLQLSSRERHAVAAYVFTLPAQRGGAMMGGGGGPHGRGGAHRHGAQGAVPQAVEEAVTRIAEPAVTALRAGLSQRLMAALQAGGAEGAIDVCAVEAVPLTDSIAAAAGPGITLERTSTRLRNPRNAPDSLETEALRWFETELRAGREPTRLLQTEGSAGYRYYAPLRVMALCLDCHGSAASLTPAVRRTLERRYPDDRATGYSEGDLRGLVRVSIPAAAVR